jgi:hypothetical protein
MTSHLRDEATDRDGAREREYIPLIQRLEPVQRQFAKLAKANGLPADKAFFDDLSGDL